MTDKDFHVAIARSLYWGYKKDTTGTPGKWSELPPDERKIWIATAKRATRKIDELQAAPEAAYALPLAAE